VMSDLLMFCCRIVKCLFLCLIASLVPSCVILARWLDCQVWCLLGLLMGTHLSCLPAGHSHCHLVRCLPSVSCPCPVQLTGPAIVLCVSRSTLVASLVEPPCILHGAVFMRWPSLTRCIEVPMAWLLLPCPCLPVLGSICRNTRVQVPCNCWLPRMPGTALSHDMCPGELQLTHQKASLLVSRHSAVLVVLSTHSTCRLLVTSGC